MDSARNVPVEVSLSPSDPPDGYFDGFVVGGLILGEIPRASEQTVGIDITVPFGFFGRQRIYMRVDPDDNVLERREDDNSAVSGTILNVVC